MGSGSRVFEGNQMVIASHNEGKVNEIAELLIPHVGRVYSASELNLFEPEETGKTYIENAKLKALAASESTGLPALADDSGLSVHSLGGDPGVLSARWADELGGFDAAMGVIHERLSIFKDKSASFECALCIAWPDSHVEIFEGTVKGTIVWPPRGTLGFGYDPIFVGTKNQQTFGEICPDKKHRISHRARAFRRLVESVF